MIRTKRLISALALGASALMCTPLAISQSGTSVYEGDWPDYNGNMAAQRYSPLDQINADNVESLQLAWRFSTANFGPNPEFNATFTPLEVDGVLYTPVGAHRDIAAIDATSGQLLWLWRPQEGERYDAAPRKGSGRGVAFWSDGDKRRILTITPGFYLVSLDADTGLPDPEFGNNGIIDMQEGLRLGPGREDIDIGSSMPPFVMNNVVVVGPAMAVSMRPPSKANVKGDVRAYDVRTGEHLWTFHTIPRPGEFGYDTWLNNSADFTGNTGVWAPMSGDPELGHVYLPVEAPTGDRFGGDRPGDNLFGTSLVAVDVNTGERQWHYQIIRHDIWDWDNPAAPILADLPNGRKIVMQVTKQSYVYTFDRETGEPIWPIEDLPVPAGDVPGEWYAATQPFPTKPAGFDRQGINIDDLIDFTPELREAALEAIKPFRLGTNLYSPPSQKDAPDGTQGTLSLPSATGGANWEGAAMDPETGMLYVPSRTVVAVLSVDKDPRSDIDFSMALGVRPPRAEGLPIVKPPYGRITAIDMNSGDHVWMIANADTPPNIANNPALEGVDLPRTGVETRSGVLLTKTLLFAGEGTGGGPMLRAHDKETGEIIAEIEMPGTQTGQPFTYEHNGKQYVAMVVSARGQPSELVAYALP
ncbi:PQQ-binding-like beta-propeller repeat protein [Pseudohongiella spirulinae]|uniref:Quinoprotein glucose dehydrogenase n=1 Tax=Pseudohongiella spirulinae TaxID=1249552 RepID=A0A0S2KBT6_9GAMM|nr:PQQ-binding-like beta-propeller repeat protein [Pseudohongiella spirulinae]ALO45598.1 Quinoprotein glucose dehydrogenase [Pseudohongiella spirulinae]